MYKAFITVGKWIKGLNTPKEYAFHLTEPFTANKNQKMLMLIRLSTSVHGEMLDH